MVEETVFLVHSVDVVLVPTRWVGGSEHLATMPSETLLAEVRLTHSFSASRRAREGWHVVILTRAKWIEVGICGGDLAISYAPLSGNVYSIPRSEYIRFSGFECELRHVSPHLRSR